MLELILTTAIYAAVFPIASYAVHFYMNWYHNDDINEEALAIREDGIPLFIINIYKAYVIFVSAWKKAVITYLIAFGIIWIFNYNTKNWS